MGVYRLMALLLLICLCPGCKAEDYYPGNQYVVSTAYDANWTYLWSASYQDGSSAGTFSDRFKSTTIWTAPGDLINPSGDKITISVLVSASESEGCLSKDSIDIILRKKNVTARITIDPQACDGHDAPAIVDVFGPVDIRKVTLYYFKGQSQVPRQVALPVRIPGAEVHSLDMVQMQGQPTRWLGEIPSQPAGNITIFALAIDGRGNVYQSDAAEAQVWLAAPKVTVNDAVITDINRPATLNADVSSSPVNVTEYQWYRGRSSASGEKIDGARSKTYQAYEEGAYTCLVISQKGCASEGCCNVTIRIPRHSVSLAKTVSPATVSPGGEATYTIRFSNTGDIDLTDVLITDFYPKGVIYKHSNPDPRPGTDNTWAVGFLPPGAGGMINITVKIPLSPDMRFSMDQGVRGKGFVNVYRDLSTREGPYSLINVVTLTSAQLMPVNSSAVLKIDGGAGTEVSLRESGSGDYAEHEMEKYSRRNRSIEVRSDLFASYAPTEFDLPCGRSLRYGSKWEESSRTNNEITGTSTSEEYSRLSNISRKSSIKIDKGGTTLRTEVGFDGSGRLEVVKKNLSSHDSNAAAFESQESYVGRFNLSETVDEYGPNVASDRSVSGMGFVASDKRVGKSQRTYEHGSGSYRAKEQIRTFTGYISKDVSASTSQVLGPRTGLNWTAGTWSRSSNTTLTGGGLTYFNCPSSITREYVTYMGAEIRDASRLEANIVAKGTSRLSFDENYSGTGELRVAVDRPERRASSRLAESPDRVGGDDYTRIDLDEVYAGSYQVSGKIALTGASKYNSPHLSVSGSGSLVQDVVVPGSFGGRAVTLARYAITIVNDGDADIEPAYLEDIFPLGSEFVSSTLRPSSSGPGYANWTLTNIDAGQGLIVELVLRVDKCRGNLVNRVEASGSSAGMWATSQNYDIIERAWLGQGCCQPRVSLDSEAYVDPSNPTMIRHRLTLVNLGDVPVAARLEDYLPEDAQLLEASLDPSEISGRRITWVFNDVAPVRHVNVDCGVRALMGGRATSRAYVEAWNVEGEGSASAQAMSTVNLEGSSNASSTSDSVSWVPPDWNFTSSDEGLDLSALPETDGGYGGINETES